MLYNDLFIFTLLLRHYRVFVNFILPRLRMVVTTPSPIVDAEESPATKDDSSLCEESNNTGDILSLSEPVKRNTLVNFVLNLLIDVGNHIGSCVSLLMQLWFILNSRAQGQVSGRILTGHFLALHNWLVLYLPCGRNDTLNVATSRPRRLSHNKEENVLE